MHLLAITTTSDRSEVAIYSGLVQRGHTVDMLCHAEAPENEALRAAGVRLHPIRIRHRLDLPAVRHVRQAIRGVKPNVIYAPRNSSLAVSLMATSGTLIPVVTYRGTIGHISRFDPAAWLTYLHPRLRRIVCVSEAVRRYLLKFNPPAQQLVTIHKGHALDWYDAMPKPTRASLGLPTDAILVGFTGRMRPVKGGDVLLRAMARLSPQLNVHLVIVGEVADPVIRQLTESLHLQDRIHCLGFRADAAALAAVFDVFVMPSLEREGLPRAVIEAMAQRVAPIVTNVGGMPELVQDGISGLVIPPNDPGALAAAIAALARDPARCRTMGAAARRRIETNFNITDTILQMEQVLQGVVVARNAG